MTKRGLAFVALALATLSLPARSAAQENAGASEPEREVQAVVQSFKAALQVGDSLTVLDLLHPDVRVYEGGHAETRDQYRSGHLRSDIAFLGAVASETTWDSIIVGSDVDAHGTETIALVPTQDGWRIRHIHWSSR
jgi:ketosteroid isomerase-like protein